ncbi:LysR family transcriptional regulator [soil metagenome]
MDISCDDVRIFLAVAEARSLSGAARKLGIAQPTISRRLAALEARTGEPMFQRSVSGATLTSYGERLLGPARNMAQWAAEVDRAAESRQTSPNGVVRITAPPGIAFDVLAPFAAWLKTKLPLVQLEVLSTVRYLDLGRREADLALRFEAIAQRDVVALCTIETEIMAFAARAYIAALPKGYTAADVGWIAWAPPYEGVFPNPQLAKLLPGFVPAFASDDYLVQLRAAVEGVGAMLLGRMRHRFARDVGLVPLTPVFWAPKARLHLAAGRTALEIPRVRAVADLLTRELENAGKKRRLMPVSA